MVALQRSPNILRPSGSRKRRHSSCASHQPDSAPAAPPAKKQKLPPLAPTFWDNLSRIPLTKNALRELDRRNSQHGSLERSSPKGLNCLDKPASRGGRSRSRHDVRKDDRCISAGEILAALSSAGRRQIKRFALHGGPALSFLRGHRVTPIARSSMSYASQSSLGRRKRGSQGRSKSSTLNSTTTKSTGPYDRAFQQHLIDYQVFPDGYEYPDGRVPPEPENMEEILEVLARSRASLSPSRFSADDFRKFKRADTNAPKERQVTATVIPIIEGDTTDSKCRAGEIPFTNLHPLTNGTLVPGNPDLYYGARPEQLDRRIREKLSGLIVPSTQEDLPILPNFFVEIKGPEGLVSVAKRQLTYDMSLGARGYLEAESYYGADTLFDQRAHTLGCTYQDGNLKMYASHLIPPSTPGARPGYVTTQLGAWALSGSWGTFRQGAAAYRNGRDWAKQQRDKVIKQANTPAEGTTRGLVSTSEVSATDTHGPPSQDTATNPYDSDSSADELGIDFQPKRLKVADDPP